MIRMDTGSQRARERRLELAVFVTLFAFFLLTGSRERPWGDAQVMWEVAESIVARGRIDIAYEWPPMSHRGADGNVYSQYALLPSLVQIPGAVLLQYLGARSDDARTFWWPMCAHIAPGTLAASGCVVFFRVVRQLRCSRGVASIATLVLALATGVWVYARYAYSEALQLMCFVGFAHTVLTAWGAPSRRNALAFGAWSGALINAKLVYALSIPVACLALFLAHRRIRAGSIRFALWSLVGTIPFVLALLAYNHARWGHPFTTGYDDTILLYRETPWSGAWGLAFSPGKSVFLYSPPVVMACIGWGLLLRSRDPALAWVAAITALPMLSYVRHLSWSGGWCWGPRYWTFALPIIMLGFAATLQHVRDRVERRARVLWKVGLSTFAVLGVWVQLLGNAFYWDHWIRIGKDARTDWLGEPDRRGAAIPERGRGHCDSCFEDLHALLWLPPFQPIVGHAWLVRHVAFEHAWEQAERDAPWHRYTTLQLDVERSYRRVRFDWWGLLWLRDIPSKRTSGLALLAVFVLATMGGAVYWIRSTRAAKHVRDRSS